MACPHRAENCLDTIQAAPRAKTNAVGFHLSPRPADEGELGNFLVAKPTKTDAVDGKPATVAHTLTVTDGPTDPLTVLTGPPFREG